MQEPFYSGKPRKTRLVKAGAVSIGGGSRISVQSMYLFLKKRFDYNSPDTFLCQFLNI